MIKRVAFFIFLVNLLLVYACTDLEPEIESQVVGDEDINNPQTAPSLLASAYAILRYIPSHDGIWSLAQHTTDETMGPTRGADWFDNGRWQQLHTHTWTSTHSNILDAWNRLNFGVGRSNLVLSTLKDQNTEQANLLKAEARFLRAFYYYNLMDMFGSIPFRDENQTDFRVPTEKVYSRSEMVEFLTSELELIIPILPTRTEAPYGRVTKGAAHTLLAKIYLNLPVYTGQENYPKVIEHTNAVINSGEYSLNNDYFENFVPNNQNSPEAILVAIFDNSLDLGYNYVPWRWTLHYNHPGSAAGWNGFTTISDFYNKWNKDDPRFRNSDPEVTEEYGVELGFLEGQQYNYFAPNNPPIVEDNGPLIYSVDVPLRSANRFQGVRVVKYAPDQFSNSTQGDNDFIIFRLADVYLMRAEAFFRTGNTPEALTDVNFLRSIRNVPALSSLTEDDLLNERGFELYWEGWRRQDLIRFGRFTETWDQKPASASFRKLFPYPQEVVDVTPNLVQNPGY